MFKKNDSRVRSGLNEKDGAFSSINETKLQGKCFVIDCICLAHVHPRWVSCSVSSNVELERSSRKDKPSGGSFLLAERRSEFVRNHLWNEGNIRGWLTEKQTTSPRMDLISYWAEEQQRRQFNGLASLIDRTGQRIVLQHLVNIFQGNQIVWTRCASILHRIKMEQRSVGCWETIRILNQQASLSHSLSLSLSLIGSFDSLHHSPWTQQA